MKSSAVGVGSVFVERPVSAAGFTVSMWEAGPPGADPVVYLHGAGGPRFTVALDLLAERFRVVVVQMPGWGEQTNDANTFDELAAQVGKLETAAGYETFHLLGTSFGGACALHFALLFPERVRSLALEAPAKFRDESRRPDQIPP